MTLFKLGGINSLKDELLMKCFASHTHTHTHTHTQLTLSLSLACSICMDIKFTRTFFSLIVQNHVICLHSIVFKGLGILSFSLHKQIPYIPICLCVHVHTERKSTISKPDDVLFHNITCKF